MWPSCKGANPLLLSSTWEQSCCLTHFQLINISPALEPIINPPDNIALPLHQTTVQRSSKSPQAWSQNFTPSWQHNQRWTWETSRAASFRCSEPSNASQSSEPNQWKHLQWGEKEVETLPCFLQVWSTHLSVSMLSDQQTGSQTHRQNMWRNSVCRKTWAKLPTGRGDDCSERISCVSWPSTASTVTQHLLPLFFPFPHFFFNFYLTSVMFDLLIRQPESRLNAKLWSWTSLRRSRSCLCQGWECW